MRIKSKLEQLVSSVLPYLKQQISGAMNEPIEVTILVMDKKGDTMAFCTLPDEFLMAQLHGLLAQKRGELLIRSVVS